MNRPRLFRTGIKWVAGAALTAAAIIAGFLVLHTGGAVQDSPTAQVTRGEFVDYMELRGQLKALRSSAVTAPFSAGDLQIIRITPGGTSVRKGDVVVQFDEAVVQRNLRQLRSDLKQANADTERSAAHAKLQEEKTLTELSQAQYDVERARLDTTTEEVVSAIEAEKNRLALDSAERKLRAIQARVESERVAASADMESKRQKRDKIQFDVDVAERNLSSLTVTAPVSGIVNLLPNLRAAGPIVTSGSSTPEFKAGDRAWSGAVIAEIPDLSVLRVSALADEIGRSRLALEQEAVIRVDAAPDREYGGRVVSISTLTKIDYANWPPKNNFDVTLSVENSDSRLKPGMSATVRIAVDRVPDALTIPSEAAFQKAGRNVVYVRNEGQFEERLIQIGRRSGGRLLILAGLKPDEKVALRDPTRIGEGN